MSWRNGVVNSDNDYEMEEYDILTVTMSWSNTVVNCDSDNELEESCRSVNCDNDN